MGFKVNNIDFKLEYNNADELLNDMFRALANSNHIMYRGISQKNEKYPSITREYDGKKIDVSKEIPMLQDFLKYGAALIEGGTGTVDFIACAQHFGMPTRLLDWSTNPFVALFFSLSKKYNEQDEFGYQVFVCDKNKQVIFDDFYFNMSYNELASQSTDTRIYAYKSFIQTISDDSEFKELCEKRQIIIGSENSKSFIVINTNDSNTRLKAQKGLFVIPRKLEIESIDNEYLASGVHTITVNPSIRNDVMQKLERLGYSSVQLFSDLQNISAYIRKKAIE